MNSPTCILSPAQAGAIALPIGNIIITASAGTATKAIRDDCSSAADRRMAFNPTWVNRARNSPGPVIKKLRQPSACIAAPKSSGSLNADETLSGISVSDIRSLSSTGGETRA
jgi:hypothetical protein